MVDPEVSSNHPTPFNERTDPESRIILRDKDPTSSTLLLLIPLSRAHPETLALFAGKESSSTALNQQGSH